MSEPLLDQKEAIRKAKKEGFKVFRSSPRWLLIDIDCEGDLEIYDENLEMIQKTVHVKEVRRWKSKSGDGWHILVKLPEGLPVAERMLMQAILGSDLKREWYNLLRVKTGNPEPALLFEPPNVPAPRYSRFPDISSQQSDKNEPPQWPFGGFDDDVPF